jgi:hypothetical protein
LVITLSAGMLMLALSSLTRRSLYVGIAWAGLWIISGTVGLTMTQMQMESVRRGVVEEEMTQWLAEHPPPPGIKMRGWTPQTRWQFDKKKPQLVGLESGQEEAGERWYQSWSNAMRHAFVNGQEKQAEAAKSNAWPLCSYVGNLNRIAEVLLGTDAAWVKIGQAAARQIAVLAGRGPPGFGPPSQPAPANERIFADRFVAQYPWWWSAAVLTCLLGISTWTLTRRVKSLDRLK